VNPRQAAEADARERRQRLALLHGPNELRCALLAWAQRTGSAREQAVWQQASREVHDAERLRNDMQALLPTERLPWFELLARRAARGSLEERRLLVETARRVMAADGAVGPRDRLRWLALRHLLGAGGIARPAAASTDLAALPDTLVLGVVGWAAFLSRLVPDVHADEAGGDWYAAVSARWAARFLLPARDAMDADATLRALRSVQTLPWMLRPVLLREWFDAAAALTPGVALHAGAAEALRLCALLLEAPLPPALARQFVESGLTA
jgi:hypothetical protein